MSVGPKMRGFLKSMNHLIGETRELIGVLGKKLGFGWILNPKNS